MENNLMNWIINNWLEIFGVMSALIYLLFSIRQNFLLWPVGLFSSALYVYVFWKAQLYADMGLSFYYVLISVYGWYNWVYGANSGVINDLKLRWLKRNEIIRLTFISSVVYVIILVSLFKLPVILGIPSADMPYWDALTTALAIIGTWMLTQKIIEQWLIWVIVDAVSTVMYFYKGIELTAGLYLVYTVMAIVGFIRWRSEFNKKLQFVE